MHDPQRSSSELEQQLADPQSLLQHQQQQQQQQVWHVKPLSKSRTQAHQEEAAASAGKSAQVAAAETPAAEGVAAAAEMIKARPAAEVTAAAAAEPEDLSLILAAARNGSRRQQQEPSAPQLYGVDPADATSAYIRARGSEPVRLKYPLWWHGPVWSGSGYGSGRCCSHCKEVAPSL
jgi:hypothetical protein